jgi:hypothetical protein
VSRSVDIIQNIRDFGAKKLPYYFATNFQIVEVRDDGGTVAISSPVASAAASPTALGGAAAAAGGTASLRRSGGQTLNDDATAALAGVDMKILKVWVDDGAILLLPFLQKERERERERVCVCVFFFMFVESITEVGVFLWKVRTTSLLSARIPPSKTLQTWWQRRSPSCATTTK